jgi:hypothetical protein
MTIPSDPSQNRPAPSNPANQEPISPGGGNVDPTGVWTKFLSAGGMVATPQEVKMFMQGMLKMFNVIIQQQNEAYQRSNEALKKAARGDD